MKTAIVEYTLLPDTSASDVEDMITEFVKRIGALDLGIRYESYRREPGRYMHVARFPDEAALASLQSSDFFPAFGKKLRSLCKDPPTVTWVDLVAHAG